MYSSIREGAGRGRGRGLPYWALPEARGQAKRAKLGQAAPQGAIQMQGVRMGGRGGRNEQLTLNKAKDWKEPWGLLGTRY